MKARWSTAVFVVLLVAGLGAIPASADPAELVVDDDGYGTASNCDDGATSAYAAIQGAVDAAYPGDTVLVCPGTYAEQVVVAKKDITIAGSGQGTQGTVIAPTSVAANTTSLFSGAPIAAIVLVDGVTGVTLRDLTVDGGRGAFNGCSPGYMGIFYRNASGSVDAVTVQNVFHPNAPGCQAVLGIFVQSGVENQVQGSSHVSVSGSVVSNYGKNGITCNEPGTACEITGNVVMAGGRQGPATPRRTASRWRSALPRWSAGTP